MVTFDFCSWPTPEWTLAQRLYPGDYPIIQFTCELQLIKKQLVGATRVLTIFIFLIFKWLPIRESLIHINSLAEFFVTYYASKLYHFKFSRTVLDSRGNNVSQISLGWHPRYNLLSSRNLFSKCIKMCWSDKHRRT